MYIKKSVRPIMEPSNSQALIGHSGENFHPELLKGIYFQKKKTKADQALNLKVHQTQVCEEDQNVKPF